MALFYGLVRVIAAAMTQMTAWRHSRDTKQLEKSDADFREIELTCKADEVSQGRPVDYTTQFRLMREFERRESANARWKRSAIKLKKRKRLQKAIREFSGRKLPYTFGVLDMALVMKGLEFAYSRSFDWSLMTDFISRLF